MSPKIVLDMKNKEELIAEPQLDKVYFKPMTEEELLQMAVLSQKSFFKEKYRHGLKVLTLMDIHRLQQDHPDWRLKDVLAAILKNYNPELPAVILLEMSQFIIAEWEKADLIQHDNLDAVLV